MNTKHPLYKEKLKVQRELDELYVIQRNQNWIELEKPYRNGYYKVLDLRDDIKNREDAWVFYECLRLTAKDVWCRDKSFKRKIKKGKYEYIAPGFGYIYEKTYESLHPAVKKHFRELTYGSRDWHPLYKKYECSVPNYYFVEKIKPRWVTHYKEFDSVIAQEEAEKYDYLHSEKFWPVLGWYGGAPKSYCQPYNRSDRRHSKRTVHRNISQNDEDHDFDKYEYRYNHKHSARWDYW